MNIKEKCEEVLAKLQQLSEEAEVKIKLASMEIRSTWERIEIQLRHIRERLHHFACISEQKSDEATLQSHLALMEAKERWHGVQDTMGEITEHLSHKAQPVIDHAKVQAHLAKLEVVDFVHELEPKGQKIGHMSMKRQVISSINSHLSSSRV